jgi:RimJ/RimL family protein N-acetyltransferase
MVFPGDILTKRLRLVVITPELMSMEPSVLRHLLHVDVPASWPPENWEPHVFDFMKQQRQSAPQTARWNRYVIDQTETPVLVGTVGGFPRTRTEAEIGYSILPPWQRRGLATESVRALLEEIFRDSSRQSVSAQTYPNLRASMRVLEKCGFQHAGEGDEVGTVRYRLMRL